MAKAQGDGGVVSELVAPTAPVPYGGALPVEENLLPRDEDPVPDTEFRAHLYCVCFFFWRWRFVVLAAVGVSILLSPAPGADRSTRPHSRDH